MPQVTVNVFTGVGDQVPDVYRVDGNTYQDIATALINLGLQSGRIYGINGEVVDYNSNIELPEVNYIIPEGEISYVNISSPRGFEYMVPFNVEGTFRDVYNQAVAKGLPLNSKIILMGKGVDLDSPVKPHNLMGINTLHVIPRQGEQQMSRVNRQPEEWKVRTPINGEMAVNVVPGVTTAMEVAKAVNQENHPMKLARVTRGAYDVYIYGDREVLKPLGRQEKLYLVPEYDSLFSGYSAMVAQY